MYRIYIYTSNTAVYIYGIYIYGIYNIIIIYIYWFHNILSWIVSLNWPLHRNQTKIRQVWLVSFVKSEKKCDTKRPTHCFGETSGIPLCSSRYFLKSPHQVWPPAPSTAPWKSGQSGVHAVYPADQAGIAFGDMTRWFDECQELFWFAEVLRWPWVITAPICSPCVWSLSFSAFKDWGKVQPFASGLQEMQEVFLKELAPWPLQLLMVGRSAVPRTQLIQLCPAAVSIWSF